MIEFILKLFVFAIVASIWLVGLLVLLAMGGISMLVNRDDPDSGADIGEMIRDWSRGFDSIWREF